MTAPLTCLPLKTTAPGFCSRCAADVNVIPKRTVGGPVICAVAFPEPAAATPVA